MEGIGAGTVVADGMVGGSWSFDHASTHGFAEDTPFKLLQTNHDKPRKLQLRTHILTFQTKFSIRCCLSGSSKMATDQSINPPGKPTMCHIAVVSFFISTLCPSLTTNRLHYSDLVASTILDGPLLPP